MNLNHWAQRNPALTNLLQQHKQQQQLLTSVKRLLPANLQPHVQAAFIDNNILKLITTHPIAASRIKMLAPTLLPSLQNHHPQITSIHIKNQPAEPEKIQKTKTFRLPENAVPVLKQTADSLSRHPRLSYAIKQLLQNRLK